MQQKRLATRKNILLLTGILLIAANLRTAITSVTPLIGFIRDDTGISNGIAGLLTTLPLIAFAILSMFAPKIARRFGIANVLMASLVILTFGILLRSNFAMPGLLLGTFILGLAIAMGNVLLPSLIKQRFPWKVGLMTGLYTTSMNLFASIASGLSVPLAQDVGLGWRITLGLAAILTVVAIIVWLPQMRFRKHQDDEQNQAKDTQKMNLWRSPLAWKVTLFMGIQSLIFYVIMTWLPEILIDQGVTASTAGWMIALLQFISIPASFIMPLAADRIRDHRGLVSVAIIIPLIGVAGLLLGVTQLAALWSTMFGLGMGACLSLSLTFIAMRAPDPEHTSELSGMAQATGYLLAAIGPALFGWMRDAVHSWFIPIVFLIAFCIVLFIVGMGAGRHGHVESQ